MRSPIGLLLLFLSGLLFGTELTIEPGDHLFLSAEFVECEEKKKKLIGYAEVNIAGNASFFELKISAAGGSGQDVARELAERIEKETGNKPTSLEVTVVPKSDE